MSLDLDPQPSGAGEVCLGYRLSIDSGFPHSGRIGMSYGEQRSVQLEGAPPIRVQFHVARAGAKDELRELFKKRARPVI
jgi:hypothetical protein